MRIGCISSPEPIRRGITGLAGRAGNAQASTRAALFSRVNGFFKNMIEAIANSKLRRMERELELRGIRYDREKDNWVSRK